mmetsp:Transcript_59326/g.104358  ORF Transcript_59326/g.104358 Transcript_59326/m.104358 type:complete len:249 (+) Transcript_59326:244-990(+)
MPYLSRGKGRLWMFGISNVISLRAPSAFKAAPAIWYRVCCTDLLYTPLSLGPAKTCTMAFSTLVAILLKSRFPLEIAASLKTHSASIEVPSRRSVTSGREVYLSLWKSTKPLCVVFTMSRLRKPACKLIFMEDPLRFSPCTCAYGLQGPLRVKTCWWGTIFPLELGAVNRSHLSLMILTLILFTISGYSVRKCLTSKMPNSSAERNSCLLATQYTVFLQVSVGTTFLLSPVKKAESIMSPSRRICTLN